MKRILLSAVGLVALAVAAQAQQPPPAAPPGAHTAPKRPPARTANRRASAAPTGAQSAAADARRRGASSPAPGPGVSPPFTATPAGRILSRLSAAAPPGGAGRPPGQKSSLQTTRTVSLSAT